MADTGKMNLQELVDAFAKSLTVEWKDSSLLNEKSKYIDVKYGDKGFTVWDHSDNTGYVLITYSTIDREIKRTRREVPDLLTLLCLFKEAVDE